jgi:diaminohydroxyphosphoribosylaminopyrimidine deaminase/5-amino-6-(5-phosphoribosylamino)uracil reductase
VIGSGFHRRPGSDHAEVRALRQAGAGARGATLYVNLEPCSHHGRTPPCVDAIRAAAIRRVVACHVDPNPRVRGRGFAILRRAGVEVSVGLLEADARELNEAYLRFIISRRPFVVLKAGMSLDGRIAVASGASRWITSPAARREGRRLRRGCDAVLVGVGTVIADDPTLAAAIRGREKRGFLRVVLDSRLRIPASARLLRAAPLRALRIYTTRAASASRARRLERAGATVVRVVSRAGRVDPRAVASDLGRLQVASLLVEGGGEVHASFLEAGLVDKVVLFIAPRFLGGRDAVPVVGGRGAAKPQAGFELRLRRTERIGPDLAWIGAPVRRRKGG